MRDYGFWLHGLIFNIAWFLCVVQQHTVLALCTLAIWVAVAPLQRAEAVFVLVIALLGITVDSFLTQANWLIFEGSDWHLMPAWMLLLWLAFSRFLYRWLTQIKLNPSLSVLLFAVLGPVNYGVGQGLGAVTINWMLIWGSALFLLWWACLIPLGLWVNRLCEKRFATS